MRKTVYEWDIETVDLDTGALHSADADILDHCHADRLRDLPDPGHDQRLVLVRDVIDGTGVIDRSHAYVGTTGYLPDLFTYGEGEMGERVPQRFHDEIAENRFAR